MAKSFVDLSVKDSGFNQKIKSAIQTFAQLSGAAMSAKGSFSKMADSLADVAQSQMLVNKAMKGNPYGLYMQAATIAITKIIELSNEASDAEKRAMEWAERRAEKEKTVTDAIGRSTGDLMAKYELLRYSWAALSTEQEKNDWIKQNQSAFKGLNLAVNDVTSAENVFVKNTSQVVAALKARAEAEAYGELYKEEIKKSAMKKASGAYNPQRITADYRPSITEAKLAGLTNADYEHKTKQIWSIPKGGYVDYQERTGRLTKSGIAKMQALKNMGAASLENADRMGAEYYGNMMLQAQAKALELGKGLLGPVGGGGGKGGNKTIKEEKDDFEDIVGLINNAKEAVADLQRQRNEAETVDDIDAIDKKLAVAVQYYNDLVNRGKEVKKTFETGLSGFNANTMNAWMQGRQSDLSKAEYGSAEYKDIAGNIADMNTIKTLLEQSMNAGINLDLTSFWEQVFDGDNIPDETWQGMVNDINAKLAEMKLEPIKINFQSGELASDGKEVAKDWKEAGTAISAVGSAMSQIEDPAAKVMGTVAQAIATIALTFAKSLTGTFTPWDWIAAAASGVATMISVINTIHSATGYAQGGMVQGNTYSGDQIPIMANAGEVVLTRAMQGSLAQQLQGTGLQNLNLKGVVSGEQIMIVLDRHLQRSGRGELAVWK